MSRDRILTPRTIEDLVERAVEIAPAVRERAEQIVNDVRAHGEAALRRYALEFGERTESEPLVLDRPTLAATLAKLPVTDRERLERVADRIRRFAEAQRNAMQEITVAVPGGHAGHTIEAVERAGCYAPGGRYPLPSSVLMTAVTARVAGVQEVIVASPNPAPITLAAAAVSGADAVLAAGGAHAIGALAFGASAIPACDVVVGPGNSYVTAAKQIVAGHVRIDMLAGPSELVILADDSADPVVVAADLLAQAEHDPEALPVLITTSTELATLVEDQLERQLATLPSADIARTALAHGGYMAVRSMDEGVEACNRLAPEHLEVMARNDVALGTRLRHCGALFLGSDAAEVFGDYGIGPNHVLPTGTTARSFAGLSVFNFLRLRTWMRLEGGDPVDEMVSDASWLARHEGLEAHARAAEARS